MRFSSAKKIRQSAIDTHNCHPTVEFIRKWAKRHHLPISGEWSESDLIRLANEGDLAYAESRQSE